MNKVQNQNGKVLQEMLTGSNSNVVKTTLRGYVIFKMVFPLKQVPEKLLIIPLSLGVESVTNGSVG